MAMMVGADSGSNGPPCPPGRAFGVCIDVFPVKRKRDGADMIRMKWAIYFVNGQAVRRPDGSFYHVSKDYTPSMHQNAWLRKDLERLRGRPYTEDQIKQRVDVERLLGFTAELFLVPGSNPAYTNIDTLLPAPAGYTLPIPEGYRRQSPNDPAQRGGRHAGPGLPPQDQPPPPAAPGAGYPPASPQQTPPPAGAAPPQYTAAPAQHQPPAAPTYDNFVPPPLESDDDLALPF